MVKIDATNANRYASRWVVLIKIARGLIQTVLRLRTERMHSRLRELGTCVPIRSHIEAATAIWFTFTTRHLLEGNRLDVLYFFGASLGLWSVALRANRVWGNKICLKEELGLLAHLLRTRLFIKRLDWAPAWLKAFIVNELRNNFFRVTCLQLFSYLLIWVGNNF